MVDTTLRTLGVGGAVSAGDLFISRQGADTVDKSITALQLKTYALSGSGDVVGPSSATDNAIIRFDGTTGKLIQNSTATLDDSGNMIANTLNLNASTNQMIFDADAVINGTITMAALGSSRIWTLPNSSGTFVLKSSTDTLQNKTMDTSNIITLFDTRFTLQDDGDATKQAVFQLSGITTGNTRTLTIPDASGTIALTSSTVASVSGTTNRITSTGGTTPVIDISAAYVGQSSITTVGTLSSGAVPASLVTAGTFGTGNYNITGTLGISALTTALNFNATATGTTSSYQAGGTNAYWQDTTNNNLIIGASNAPTSISQSGGGINGQSIAGVGGSVLNSLTTGGYNTAFGYNAASRLTTGAQNFAMGQSALAGIVTGSNNTTVGTAAMAVATFGTASTASNNTVIGASSMNTILFSGSSSNTLIGYNIMSTMISNGGFNTIIGANVNQGNTSATSNILIGYDNTVQSGGANTANFQNFIHATGLGGTSSTPKIGIGNVNTPTAAADIAPSTTAIASLRIRSGTAPTSPNNGDMWNDGTNLFYANSTPTKLGVVVDNGTRLTSGKVPVATTSGYLIDGGATATELSYLSGVTSNVQTQLNARTYYAGSFSGVGTATTTFTVTIGATMANTTYKVNSTPTDLLAAAIFYINNKTTTTFDVVYLAGLTGTITFDWSVFP